MIYQCFLDINLKSYIQITAAALNWHFGNKRRALLLIDKLNNRKPAQFSDAQINNLRQYIQNPDDRSFWKTVSRIQTQQTTKSCYENALITYAHVLYMLRDEIKESKNLFNNINKWFYEL